MGAPANANTRRAKVLAAPGVHLGHKIKHLYIRRDSPVCATANAF